MDKTTAPHRWFSGWRAPAPAVDSDPADMGTAFGLDLSLHEMHQKTTPPGAAVPRQAGWMQRLTERNKTRS